RALRRGKIDILNHQRFRTGIEVNHGNRLLGLVRVRAELDAVPAVDDEQISALAAVSEGVGTAKHRHWHGPDSRQMSRGVNDQRAGRRDRPPLTGGFSLAPGASAKAETNHKKTTGHGSRIHRRITPIPEED